MSEKPTNIKRHIVGLSGGKDSTAMSLRLCEQGRHDYTFVCTPTGDELPSMAEHWGKLEILLGKKIVRVDPGYTLKTLISKMGMLPNFRARFCTRMLKIVPYEHWIHSMLPVVSYIGLRADEMGRSGYESCFPEEQFEMQYPLRDWGWGRGDVEAYLGLRGVEVPPRTDCARCPLQTLGEWRELWQKHPAIYEDACRDEDIVGHTYRSPSRDTWPAGLRDLAREFMAGREVRQRRRGATCRACTL